MRGVISDHNGSSRSIGKGIRFPVFGGIPFRQQNADGDDIGEGRSFFRSVFPADAFGVHGQFLDLTGLHHAEPALRGGLGDTLAALEGVDLEAEFVHFAFDAPFILDQSVVFQQNEIDLNLPPQKDQDQARQPCRKEDGGGMFGPAPGLGGFHG
jgi:hypothetical protein